MAAIRSILIPDGEDELALRVLRCLAEIPHFKVAVLSRDPWSPIRFSRHAHRFLVHSCDGFDRERVQAIKNAAKAVGADIIFPTGLPGIRLVAEYYQELASIARLPLLSSRHMLDTFADKLLFSEILEREGIQYPKVVRPKTFPIDSAQMASVRLPALVKPRNREAGNGIRLCENEEQIATYLSEQKTPSDFFIQEFIRGPDFSCSVLSQDGEILAHTLQQGIIPSHKPFHPPAAIKFIHHQGAFDSIQRLIRSVRWSGVVNFDLVLDEETNEAKVLEANPRYWRSLLGSLSAGVNFPHLACLASEGHPIPQTPYRKVRYAKPDLALSILLKSYSGRPSEISPFSESGLRYTLNDPLPDVAIQVSRLLKKEGLRWN